MLHSVHFVTLWTGMQVQVRLKQRDQFTCTMLAQWFPTFESSSRPLVESPVRLAMPIHLASPDELQTNGHRTKCLRAELDRPTTNHSNEMRDAVLRDKKTFIINKCASVQLSVLLLEEIYRPVCLKPALSTDRSTSTAAISVVVKCLYYTPEPSSYLSRLMLDKRL